ncbi:hypothetical protein PIB30_062121 [Stylosanthes scabra]|uniref:Uncharacterized protein n=1 Tax=Stylosanthes scabra TaxID=79078 RepID=A0ABU6WJG4_9FABA|nr:hypothetical protein [Stylosanthes scabra]
MRRDRKEHHPPYHPLKWTQPQMTPRLWKESNFLSSRDIEQRTFEQATLPHPEMRGKVELLHSSSSYRRGPRKSFLSEKLPSSALSPRLAPLSLQPAIDSSIWWKCYLNRSVSSEQGKAQFGPNPEES